MANTNVSIKNASDEELDQLLMRLNKERQVQSLIADIKRGAQSKEQRKQDDYSVYDISTEVPINTLYHEADKSKSIKFASDKELDELYRRISKESEIQRMIGDMVRRAKTPEEFKNGEYWDIHNISTEVPIQNLYHKEKIEATLAHFGIIGMKWGVRRESSGGSEDHRRAKELKSRGIKHLSNAEINDLLKRLQLEKQMRDVSVNELKRGEEIVKTILNIGTTAAAIYGLSKTPLGEAISKRMRRS